MRIRAVILALLLSPAPAAAQHAFPETPRGEIGLRYWLSSGESKLSQNAQARVPGAGNPTAVMTYENLDANALELVGRLNLGSVFVKGYGGIGRINTGSLAIQRFDAAQTPGAETTSLVDSGRLGYFSVDAGREWIFLGRGRTTLGVFIGYSQWREEVDAYGVSFTGPGLSFLDVGNDVLVVSSLTTWRALRLGLAADLLVGPSMRLAVDLALVPYAEVRDEGSFHLRTSPGDLGPTPNVISEGRGAGVQIDVELRYLLRPRTELRAGVRAWYLETSDGTLRAAGHSDPMELVSTRTGLTLSLRQLW